MSFQSVAQERRRIGDELRNSSTTLRRLAASAFTAGSLSEYEARKVVRASTALVEIADKIIADTPVEAA